MHWNDSRLKYQRGEMIRLEYSDSLVLETVLRLLEATQGMLTGEYMSRIHQTDFEVDAIGAQFHIFPQARERRGMRSKERLLMRRIVEEPTTSKFH